MDKNSIKTFAIWARKALRKDVIYKARLVGITNKGIDQPLPQSVKGLHIFDIGNQNTYKIDADQIKQREMLVSILNKRKAQSGYEAAFESIVEEVAYTWFNRLIALRFMEVNDYLPSGMRVVSSSGGKLEPELVSRPFDSGMTFSQSEKTRIVEWKDKNLTDELFAFLFIKQCNDLNRILPGLFEKINGYSELLLNISYTDTQGIIYKLTHDISEDDFKEAVEIIGWLYQYYNTELKDETFALLKRNVKITKERIPAATQLFTPDWIVRYMVENSLGRLWLEGHPNEGLKTGWKYYLDEAEQEADVQRQLEDIRKEYKSITLADIKVIDPCMGSGHILVYVFDVLMQIYESQGYNQWDAAQSILENNLYGLDIDDRAHQLAYFAVMMKARQAGPRIFNEPLEPHLYAIEESNDIDRKLLQYFGAGMTAKERQVAYTQVNNLLDAFIDAKEYGSILKIDDYNWPLLKEFVEKVDKKGFLPPPDTLFPESVPQPDLLPMEFIPLEDVQKSLKELIDIAELLHRKYHVVVTNPPYMGNMPFKMTEYVKKYYPTSKYDLYSVFMETSLTKTKKNGFISLITQHSWMFISSFEQLRQDLLFNNLINIIHLGPRAFEAIGGEVVQAVAFTFCKRSIKDYLLTAIRLVDFDIAQTKKKEFFSKKNLYFSHHKDFSKFPGTPIVYWLNHHYFSIFDHCKLIDNFVERKAGVVTGNDDYFLRLWFEINHNDIIFTSSKNKHYGKYHVMQKGGSHRRFYGNYEYIIRLSDFWDPLKTNASVRRGDTDYYFNKAIGWSQVGNSHKSFRIIENSVCGTATPTIYLKSDNLFFYLLAFLNTKIVYEYLSAYNPTINLLTTDICNLPIIINEEKLPIVDDLSNKSVEISRTDWDSFETSWDFKRHPLLRNKAVLSESFAEWQSFTASQFNQLKSNEEELNRIFIEIYGLQDELTPDVADKDVTIRRADLNRDIQSLISYAVGCMFGRYSLDSEGLVYAGGDWDASKYSRFPVDKDNIIPITDDEYFKNDIVAQFIRFIETVYGKDSLEENLKFIAEALGGKGSPREVLRNYFVKDFFRNHVQIYQKRPIYWLFDSGKENGFKALIYMHRHNADTIGNLRMEYLLELQKKYETEINGIQNYLASNPVAGEVARNKKRLEKLQRQFKEVQTYDAKIAILANMRTVIDLDDGVRVNYDKVQTDQNGKNLGVLSKM